MKIINFILNGLSALLMHNPAGMNSASKDMGRKIIPEANDEAVKSLYITQEGNLYIPAVAVRNCLLNGSKGYRIGKRTALAILSGAILILGGEFLLYRDGKPLGATDFSIDVRRAVVQRQGIMRARARIETPWQLECTFGFNEELASIEHVKTALNNAGQMVGLLDYRVEKKGWFGRFEVADIEVV